MKFNLTSISGNFNCFISKNIHFIHISNHSIPNTPLAQIVGGLTSANLKTQSNFQLERIQWHGPIHNESSTIGWTCWSGKMWWNILCLPRHLNTQCTSTNSAQHCLDLPSLFSLHHIIYRIVAFGASSLSMSRGMHLTMTFHWPKIVSKVALLFSVFEDVSVHTTTFWRPLFWIQNGT